MPGIEYYSPRKAPDSKEPEVRDLSFFVEQELEKISQALSNFTSLRLEPQSVAPVKPREGQLVYADGTNWNPGVGAGIYVYTGTAFGWQRSTDDIFAIFSQTTIPFIVRSDAAQAWTAFFQNFNGHANSFIDLNFQMLDSANNVETYAILRSIILDDTNGSEDGGFQFYLLTAGTSILGPTIKGSGIEFPATQVASSNANTLDDYEEGTWTPSLGGTATYNSRAGTYTKVGNNVSLSFQMDVNTIGTGSVTNVTGVPFANNASTYGSGSVSFASNLVTAVAGLHTHMQPSASQLFFLGPTAVAVSYSVPNLFQNATQIYASITYQS